MLKKMSRRVRLALANQLSLNILRRVKKLQATESNFEALLPPAARFAHLALGMVPLSRSQNFQDVWVLHETGFERGGYFVEVGAYDGIVHSNTYLLERAFGWSGLLAEPNPTQHACIRSNRKAELVTKCVTESSGKTMQFWATEVASLSSLAGHALNDSNAEERARRHTSIDVESISLNDLLQEAGAPADIGYISIDTEGNEPDILAAFDFDKWRPRCLTIEHNYVNQAVVDSIVLKQGYQRRFPEVSQWDAWYVRD